MPTSKRRCRYCKAYGRPENGNVINGAYYCNLGHAIAYGRENAPKARESAQKAKKAEYMGKDTQRLQKAAQAAVNRLCKLLDAGRPCISCGKPDEGGRLRNAGHYKSRGSNSALRFDLRNVHMQCTRCNLHLSGNLEGYRQGLLDSYGQWILDYLDTAPRLKSWTADELAEIAKEARAECKRLENGELPSRNWRQITGD
jgi:hypothetical protein